MSYYRYVSSGDTWERVVSAWTHEQLFQFISSSKTVGEIRPGLPPQLLELWDANRLQCRYGAAGGRGRVVIFDSGKPSEVWIWPGDWGVIYPDGLVGRCTDDYFRQTYKQIDSVRKIGKSPMLGMPYGSTRTESVIDTLENWREADHADNIVLCRNEVVRLLDEIEIEKLQARIDASPPDILDIVNTRAEQIHGLLNHIDELVSRLGNIVIARFSNVSDRITVMSERIDNLADVIVSNVKAARKTQ